MQRGLVDDRASEDGYAVALPGEAQPVKPGGPSGVTVSLEADRVIEFTRATEAPDGPVAASCLSLCYRVARAGRTIGAITASVGSR